VVHFLTPCLYILSKWAQGEGEVEVLYNLKGELQTQANNECIATRFLLKPLPPPLYTL
jgi:hypothetical protein